MIYTLLYKIFCYFCILIAIASVQVEELQFLKVRKFSGYFELFRKFWRYLEIFWRYLELFPRISRKILRSNFGIFVSEPTTKLLFIPLTIKALHQVVYQMQYNLQVAKCVYSVFVIFTLSTYTYLGKPLVNCEKKYGCVIGQKTCLHFDKS